MKSWSGWFNTQPRNHLREELTGTVSEERR
jgi:hypothetical protein